MTPIDPPPGLLDKVAEAIHNSGCGGHDCDVCIRYPEAQEAAKAAWRAVVEGLGLTEDRRVLLTGWPADPISERRLVSRWEPQP